MSPTNDSNGTGTALAPTQRHAAINEWDNGFRNLVKATVLKPKNRAATDGELALLAEQAVRTGLDPMARQIYGIYRYSSRDRAEVMTIQVGIDGLRAVAQRTGQYAGGPAPLFCGPDMAWTEVWLHGSPPAAAKAIVRKVVGGQIVETEAVALWTEYVPMYNGKPSGLWSDKPSLMLAKCAEALALRKAFPHDMSGLYTDDEMARADAVAAAQAPTQRAAPTPAAALPAPEVVDAQPVPDADADPPIVAARAKALVEAAWTVGVQDQLQLAATHVHGADVGACATKAAAVTAMRMLTASQAGRVEQWLHRKADERDQQDAAAVSA